MAQKSEVVVALGIRSVAGTPLRYEGKVIGALTVGSSKHKSINADDISLIGYMANQITTAIVKAQLYQDEQKVREQLSALSNISEAGLQTLSIEELIDEIARRIAASMSTAWSGLMLFSSRGGYMVVDHASESCAAMQGERIHRGYELIESVLASGAPTVLKRSEFKDARYRFIKGVGTLLLLPIELRQDRTCIIAVGKKGKDAFSRYEIELLDTLGSRAALAIENALLFTKLERSYLETIESLIQAVEAKDPYTCGHSEEVGEIAKLIALEMGMGTDKAEELYVAGLLHDVGKIGISNSILSKTSCLTCEEYDQIMLHPFKGYQILKPIGDLEELAEAILQHHERYDGTGYPNSIDGEDILIEARILAVADAFQAMTSDRPYRKALPLEKAIIEIKKGAGSQFDPKIAKLFVLMIERGALDKVLSKGKSCEGACSTKLGNGSSKDKSDSREQACEAAEVA